MAQGWTLVTGGNRGLGLGLATKLVGSGRRVLLASRTQEKAAEAARHVAAETRRSDAVRPLQLDVADPRSIDAAAAMVRQGYDQQISCLVNNAGVYLSPWDQATWDNARATNFEGPMQLIEELLPHMTEGARIVNVSSGLGQLHYCSTAYGDRVMGCNSIDELWQIGFDAKDKQGSGMKPTYCVTKAMLNRATQLLARDPRLQTRGTTISVVTPGWCRTEMGGGSAPRSGQQGVDSIIWNATVEPASAISGGFFMDGRPMAW